MTYPSDSITINGVRFTAKHGLPGHVDMTISGLFTVSGGAFLSLNLTELGALVAWLEAHVEEESKK